jgi:hypothetical protein
MSSLRPHTRYACLMTASACGTIRHWPLKAVKAHHTTPPQAGATERATEHATAAPELQPFESR